MINNNHYTGTLNSQLRKSLPKGRHPSKMWTADKLNM